MNLQKSTLYKFAELLDECKTARLTGTRGAEEIFNLQISDCEESIKFLPESGNVIDVGSGGGLPGIVWAVCRPDLKITLLDSINKKCSAMKNIVDALEIKNVEIVCSRCEDFAKVNSRIFDLACARAVASAEITIELLEPLVKIGGKIMTFKGKKVHEEISQADKKLRKLKLTKPELNFYGGEDSSKCIVIWGKK